MTEKKLLSFSIGPVQSFISQARKTKDSFSGSKILSDIIHHVLITFKKDQIMLPHKDIESKPNRFITIVDKDLSKSDIIEKIENIARQKYIEIAQTTFNSVFNNEAMPFGFKEQIENFLDINWLAIEYKDENYMEAYNKLDSLMGAIKNTRIYNQIKYPNSEIGETGKKCTICGERNGLFLKSTSKRNANSSNYKVVRDNYISEKETLCSVCFVKRYYEKEKAKRYPSTAEMCLMNVLSEIDRDENIYSEVDSHYKGNFTVDLLYEENINMGYIKENGMLSENLDIEKEKELISKLTNIKKKVEEDAKIIDLKRSKEVGLKLSKYYAIISFDGDSMGKWLSGIKVDEIKISLIEFHRELSKLLGKFSIRAWNVIKKPKGTIIYAGGEDFLGFINSQYIFNVMSELRQLFDTVVNQPLKIYYKNANENLNFSAGVCISHYKTTLSNTIMKAKEMENKAKEIEGKNAFAIALLKRSGETIITNYRWQEPGEEKFGLIEDIKSVVENMKRGYFSSNFVYTLGETLYMLPNKYDMGTIKEKDTIDNMIKTEIKRLVRRSADKIKMKEDCDEKINNMINLLIGIYDKSDLKGDFSNPKDNFINLLNIIIFLVKEVYHDNRD